MKRKKLIKTMKKNENCYVYIEGSDTFYSTALVIPNLESKEDIVIHNHSADQKTFKVHETISNKEYQKRLKFMINDTKITSLHNRRDNFIYSNKTDFDKSSGEYWNIKK